MITLVILVTVVLVFLGIAFVVITQLKGISPKDEVVFPYEKKPFVFDVMSELTLYRLLLELFGDRYYIFPQMSYGRLIQLKKGVEHKHRNRFDKKIADFVLCDLERAIARLVIELDGTSHLSEKKVERDAVVDKMMETIGLPILHIKTTNIDKEYIRQEVLKRLA